MKKIKVDLGNRLMHFLTHIVEDGLDKTINTNVHHKSFDTILYRQLIIQVQSTLNFNLGGLKDYESF